MKVTITELQKDFEKYLQYVEQGIDIIILRNGKEVARLISNEKSVSFLTDSLIGVLEKEYDENNMKNERMKKYESSNWYKYYSWCAFKSKRFCKWFS